MTMKLPDTECWFLHLICTHLPCVTWTGSPDTPGSTLIPLFAHCLPPESIISKKELVYDCMILLDRSSVLFLHGQFSGLSIAISDLLKLVPDDRIGRKPQDNLTLHPSFMHKKSRGPEM